MKKVENLVEKATKFALRKLELQGMADCSEEYKRMRIFEAVEQFKLSELTTENYNSREL